MRGVEDRVKALTDAQLSALVEDWNPKIPGLDNRRELLECAVQNRINLGRLSLSDIAATG